MKKVLFILGLVILAWNLSLGQTMSDPINVSKTPENNSKWAQCAMGPNGEVHIVWVEEYPGSPTNDIYYVKYDGQLSPIFKLKSEPGIAADRPSIACNAKGVIVVIWSQMDMGVFIREYDPVAKVWKPAVQISADYYQGYEQSVAIDLDGNIYTIFYKKTQGAMWSRSRINGKWENIIQMNTWGFSTHCGIACGTDGRVWAIWREKLPPYNVFYSHRTKNTSWAPKKYVHHSGSSQAHPGITVGPDNYAYITYAADVGGGDVSNVYLVTMLSDSSEENPKEEVMGVYLQHYPRVAVDLHGNKHVAIQIGGGDWGLGVRYTNNIGGTWKPPVYFSGGLVKLPGISADSYGNVALVYAGSGEVWFSSLYPITPKKMYPPSDLAGNISVISGSSFKYNLSWKANSKNITDSVKVYNIYKKSSSDTDWNKLLTVSNSTLSASFTYSAFDHSLQFSIASESAYAVESEKSTFQIPHPAIYAPINGQVNVSFNSDVAYKLTWQSNPKNNDQFVQGYQIYKKESTDSSWVKLRSVSKSTFSASFSYSDISPTIQFAVTSVSVFVEESKMLTVAQFSYPAIYPPVNPKINISINSVKGSPEVIYKLTWQSNLQNGTKFVQVYRIYKKEGTGSFVTVATLPKTASSATYNFVNPQQRIQFGITTVSIIGTESSMVTFGTQ